MKAKKVLFITQEITPYVPKSPLSVAGRELPQYIQEQGREIRTFMPKWGNINERRNQLHEVIRLSGMNLIIDDTDHPLIIKVASIQAARMQVYFIDNDDYFLHRQMVADENGNEYDDNDERAIFYARGVLETVKKLRWCPDIIHCHSWMSAFAAMYIKKAYNDEPSFRNHLFDLWQRLPTPHRRRLGRTRHAERAGTERTRHAQRCQVMSRPGKDGHRLFRRSGHEQREQQPRTGRIRPKPEHPRAGLSER